MKTTFFTLFFFLGLSSLEAQEQPGSVAIAGAIAPSMKTAMVSEFTGCVEKLVVTKVEGKEAIKACKDIAKIVANTTTRLANEAADATKASRPMIINNGWGNGGGYYGGYSNYQTGSYYRRPVIRRSPPQRRETPTRRPTPSRSTPSK